VKALNDLGIDNPHRGHVDAMETWVKMQSAKARELRDRILNAGDKSDAGLSADAAGEQSND
jgi:hypothetical protein